MELLKRGPMPDLNSIPKMEAISFRRPEQPNSIVNAMCEYQAMLDAIRDGFINRAKAEIPNDKINGQTTLKHLATFQMLRLLASANYQAIIFLIFQFIIQT